MTYVLRFMACITLTIKPLYSTHFQIAQAVAIAGQIDGEVKAPCYIPLLESKKFHRVQKHAVSQHRPFHPIVMKHRMNENITGQEDTCVKV
jgi:hypothetical protein